MATLATQFVTALKNIEPGGDATNAKTAHLEVSDALKGDATLQELGIETFLIGSYGRDVSIRRVKDVDVFARLALADSTLRPGKIMDHVEALLEEHFPGRVTRQHRSIMVEFPDFDLTVDVVIARPCKEHPEDHWEIPEKIETDGNASWVETNPIKMNELKTQANKDFLLYADDPGSGIYVPIVKLVRQLRRTWLEDQPGGYFFEVLTYHAFQAAQPSEATVAAYLTVILNQIASMLPYVAANGLDDPTMDDRKIKTKATATELQLASERIAEAATLAEEALAEEDRCLAAVKWRQLLGTTKNTDDPIEVFPLPDYCNPDGTAKSTRALTRGASTVPAGSDRYA